MILFFNYFRDEKCVKSIKISAHIGGHTLCQLLNTDLHLTAKGLSLHALGVNEHELSMRMKKFFFFNKIEQQQIMHTSIGWCKAGQCAFMCIC